MKFKIEKEKEKKTITPYYIYTIGFMEGDADGEQKYEMKIDIDKLDEYKEIILTTKTCIAHYENTGKGGYDSYKDVPNYESLLSDFHPYWSEGLPTEFDWDSLEYVDENRQKHPVNIKLDADEIAHIKKYTL